MDEEVQDVNVAEEPTESSTVEQPEATETTEKSEDSQGTPAEVVKEAEAELETAQPNSRYSERLRTLIAENKRLNSLIGVEPGAQVAEGQPSEPPADADAQLAEWLAKHGYAKREEVQAVSDRILIDSEMSRLSSQYDGSDGRPKFDRAKVEKFMAERGVYDPEIAYNSLNQKQLIDWNVKQALKNPAPVTEKASKPGQPSFSEPEEKLVEEAQRTGDWTTLIKRRLGLGKEESSYSDNP